MANYSVNSLNFNNNTHIFTLPYGTCSTGASTVAKTVSVDNFSLETGASVMVKFTATNTATSPMTLNVNNTGAKYIYYKGKNLATNSIQAGDIFTFMYDGTYWQVVGEIGVAMELITVADIDAIWGGSIQAASEVLF